MNFVLEVFKESLLEQTKHITYSFQYSPFGISFGGWDQRERGWYHLQRIVYEYLEIWRYQLRKADKGEVLV